MALWQNIQTGFNADDETINFGTRAFAESDGCIYETSTLARIQAEGEISSVPQLTSVVLTSGDVCVGVDSSLTVFSDESCSEIRFCSAFDSIIDTFSATQDGNFLFVGLRNSNVHCLHIPTHGQLVFSLDTKALPMGGQVFAKILFEEVLGEVFAVCATGIIIRFSGFHSKATHETLMASGIVEDNLEISQESICNLCEIAPVHSAVSFRSHGQLMLMAVGRGVALWSSANDWMECPFEETAPPLVKVDTLQDESQFLALDAKGDLFAVCPLTLMMRHVGVSLQRLGDFHLLGTASHETVIVCITAPMNNQCNLLMVTTKGFRVKFSLPIGYPSTLVSAFGETEELLFLESTADNSLSIDTIAVKAAVQTNPTFRLERMLTRRKFEAAEKLAKNFGLDMCLIHVARARDIVQEMQPSTFKGGNSAHRNKELYGRLIAELDRVQDMEFVCNCCVSAIPEDFSSAHNLLLYAKKRLELFAANNPELQAKVEKCSVLVCGALLRLETLDLVEVVWDVEKWLDFSSANLVSQVYHWLKKGGMEEASLVWSRHQGEMYEALQDEQAVNLLIEDIPSWVGLDETLMWLAHLLPPLLDVQPCSLSKIVAWASSKVRGLERSHVKEWPQIGVNYVEQMLKLLGSQKVSSPFLGVECSPLRPLVELRSALADLHVLRCKHYIYLPLEDYLQDPGEVALLLIDEVEASALPNLFSDFLSRYILDHSLVQDDVVAEYVSRVLQCSMGWWYWDEAPWESRVAVLIPYIANYKLRIEHVVATLEEAPIPWSSTITKLAEDTLKLKHPLTSEIREKRKQVDLNLILKKYNLKASINKVDKKRLIRYIILKNQPGMLDDIAQLSEDSEQKGEFYSLLLTHLIDKGDLTEASKVLWNLPDEIVVKVCPYLASSQVMLSGMDSAHFFHEFLSTIVACHEVARAARPPGVSSIDDMNSPSIMLLSIKEIINQYLLKMKFGKNLTLGAMVNEISRKKVLKECIQDLLLEVPENGRETELDAFGHLYNGAVYLSMLLSFPVWEGVTELVEQVLGCSNVALSARIARHLIDLPGIPPNFYSRLSSLAKQFLATIKTYPSSQIDRECSDVSSHLACEASAFCDIGGFWDVVKIMVWLQAWHFSSGNHDLSNVGLQRDALLQWRFTPLYRDVGIAGFVDNLDFVTFVHDAFTICSNPQVILTSMLDLNTCAQKLQNDQHDLAVMYILCRLFWELTIHPDWECETDALGQTHSLIISTSEILLKKVVSARQLDVDLGLGLLINLGREGALSWLAKATECTYMDLHKQKPLAQLGVVACQLLGKVHELDQFQKVAIQSSWGLKLPEYGISAKELLRDRQGQSVLKKLMGAKNVSVEVLNAFSADFGLNLKDVLLLRLQAVLLSWDPDPVVTVCSDGSKVCTPRSTQEQLLKDCWEIQAQISDTSTVRKMLLGLWEKINFYHHEVFLVVLDLLNSSNQEISTKRLMITFLKTYRRTKSADREEESFWTDMFPNSYGLPAMAEFRLPYSRMIIDTPLKIVKLEINLDNYKEWLTMATALNLTKDRICIMAIHQSVAEEFSGTQGKADTWCGSVKNEALFAAVAECAAQMDDVVEAGASLFFFTTKIPPGVDQVNAAGLCMQYMEEIMNHTGLLDFRDKVQKKYVSLATTQVLHECGLGQPCYLQLVQCPEELITELYQHPYILDWCRGTSAFCPNINQAVETISALHGLCLKTLHMSLMQEWLHPEPVTDQNNSIDEDVTATMSLVLRQEHHQKHQGIADSDENILRARYLMEYGDVEYWAQYLLVLGFEDGQSVGLRVRALQCLCVLTDPETLEELSGRSMISIQQHCRVLSYIKELETLGFAYSCSSFEACKKEELAGLVLRTQACSPRAVRFLVRLCVDFKIQQVNVWNSILQHLTELAMVKDLEDVLPHLTQMYHIWNAPAFKMAWNMLILAPFSQASKPPTDLQVEAILHALELLPTCPVKRDVDVEAALEHCFSMQKPDLAALCLPFIQQSTRGQVKEKIMSMKDPSLLVEDLRRLTVQRRLSFAKVVDALSHDVSKNNESVSEELLIDQ